jgi:hypothetical protein
MRRLITKELLEMRWNAAAVLAVVLTIVLLGDPIAYQTGTYASGWWLAPLAVAFLMGLSGYSRETADGTLGFTFSRPIRWWWVLLAKVAAGAIALGGVVIVSLPVYLLRIPSIYRPFVNGTGLAEGMAALWLAAGAAYIVGLLLSSMVPGVVLTFTVVLGGLGVWGVLGGQASSVHRTRPAPPHLVMGPLLRTGVSPHVRNRIRFACHWLGPTASGWARAVPLPRPAGDSVLRLQDSWRSVDRGLRRAPAPGGPRRRNPVHRLGAIRPHLLLPDSRASAGGVAMRLRGRRLES